MKKVFFRKCNNDHGKTFGLVDLEFSSDLLETVSEKTQVSFSGKIPPEDIVKFGENIFGRLIKTKNFLFQSFYL